MINIGILGCADVVKKHIVNALSSVKEAKISHIASRDVKKAKEWSEIFGCDYSDSYGSLLKENIDAVYIPLPIGLHEEWVIKAANAGKHILCEKSLSDNLSSVKRMIEICKKSNIVLFEDFMCDYHPQHKKVMSISKDLGDLFMFNGNFGFPPLNKDNIRYKKELGGGSLNDAGCYPVFMSRKLFQTEPVSVTCRLISDPDIKGAAFLEFPDNRFAAIAFGFDNAYQNNYSLWLKNGIIKVNRAFSIPHDMIPEVYLIKDNTEIKIDIPSANHFTLIFQDFIDAIKKKQYKYDALLNQAKVMEALRISNKKNQKIYINEI